MKIRFKGLAKLFKAIPNRAHLFPVKVLVNGKNKSFYAIRYKTGNKAMEIVLKQMRIPNDREALFDSKDGKAKNLSEKDVLNIYEKAGKPGSLNEFIQANFKKPIVKPRNSSTVDLDSKQMSIDDLINPAEEKAKKEKYIKELKSKELKHDFEKAWYSPVTDEKGNILEREDTLRMNLGMMYHNKIKGMTSKGQLDNLKAKTPEELEKELSDCRRLEELTTVGYSDNRKLNAEYWTEAIENGVRNLDDLLKFDEDFRSGKYDNNQQEEAQDQETQEDMDQYISYYKKENHEVDIANLEALRLGSEEEKKVANDERNSLANIFNNEINYMKNNVDSSVNKESLINDYNRHNKLETIFKNRKDTSYWLGLKDKVHDLTDLLAYEEKYKDGQQENQKTPEQQDKELKEKRAKQRETESDYTFIDDGEYGKIRKFGTKKIKSKGEYPKAKNLDDFVKRSRDMKDFHLDIKGRAILDMFGINAPLFNKRNGKSISLNKYIKVGGYCLKGKDGDTIEIALVSETGNSVWETEAAIHECMHSKLRNSVHEAVAGAQLKDSARGKSIRRDIEETIVELAGQGVSNLIHGNETDKQRWSYEKIVAQVMPMIWGTPEFREASKNGLHGIGREICKRLMNNDTSFVKNVVSEYFESQIDNELNGKIENRMQAIEWAVTSKSDKVERIQNDTGKSEIANLVEELKKGTISLQAALNSSQYGAIAAILITKFLEDEDIDNLDGAAEEIKYGNEGQAEMMASGRIPF